MIALPAALLRWLLDTDLLSLQTERSARFHCTIFLVASSLLQRSTDPPVDLYDARDTRAVDAIDIVAWVKNSFV